MSDFASKTLHCQDGTSDKVYQIVIQNSPSSSSLYDVIAKWGRRGNTLMSQEKLVRVSLTRAVSEMEKLIDAKRKKGYKDVEVLDSMGKAPKIQPKAQTMVPKLLPKKEGISGPIGEKWMQNHPPKPAVEDFFVPVGNTDRRIKE